MSVLDPSRLDPADFGSVELPTADAEIWRYSRIGELELGAFSPVDDAPSVDDPGGRHTVTVGGSTVTVIDDRPDVFAELNAAHASQVHVSVPPGATVTEPIVIKHSIPADHAMVCPRLVIDVAADAEVTVIEVFDSAADGPALVLPVLQLRAGPAARVRYLGINELSDQAWSIAHQQAVGDRDSSVMLGTVALGGDYARVRTEARVSGPGASTKQVALYFAGGNQMHDFRTIQDHDAPHTTSDLLFKGAVQDTAASVYTGLITIREHARGTSADQTNRNLTLSEGAWAESVPNLDIRTNDVKCSHASTVGPIDESHRFYLESRGVRPEVAERLVVLGFFDEVIGQLPASDLADDLRNRVAAKLNIGR